MAILKRFVIQNGCQHKYVEMDAGPGLVVLTGPMGSGKSNLLALLFGSLDNNYKEIFGTKAMNIRYGCGKEAAYTQTQWELRDNSSFEVTRYLQKGSPTLFINGVDSNLRGEDQITAKIRDLLGQDASELREHCVVPQAKTSAILEHKPTDRAKFWANLLGTEWLLEMQSKVSEELARVNGMLAIDWFSKHDQLSAQRNEVSLSITTTEQEIGMLQESLLKDDQYVSYCNIVQRADKAKDLRQRRDSLQATVRNLTAEINRSQQAKAEAENRLKALKDSLEPALKAKSIRDKNEMIRKTKASLQALLDRKPKLESKEPEEVSTPMILEDGVPEMRVRAANLREKILLFKTGPDVCDKCGQTIEKDPEKLKEMEKELAKLTRSLLAHDDQSKIRREYEEKLAVHASAVEVYEKLTEQFKRHEKELLATLADLGEAESEPESAGDAEQIKQEIAKLEQRLSSMDISAKSQELGKKQGALAPIVQWLDTYAAVDANELEEMRKKVQQHNIASKEIREHEQLLNQRVGRLATVEENLEEAKQELLKVEPLQKHRDSLEKAKSLLRPAELPSLVLVAGAKELVRKADSIASHLSLPFSINMNDDFEMMVHHNNGRVEPVQRLSYGQKACVATALWMAKLTSSESNLDILVLDEPSANMDSTGVRMFAEMLMALGEYLKSTKLQVWLTTHHLQLANCGQYHLDLAS